MNVKTVSGKKLLHRSPQTKKEKDMYRKTMTKVLTVVSLLACSALMGARVNPQFPEMIVVMPWRFDGLA